MINRILFFFLSFILFCYCFLLFYMFFFFIFTFSFLLRSFDYDLQHRWSWSNVRANYRYVCTMRMDTLVRCNCFPALYLYFSFLLFFYYFDFFLFFFLFFITFVRPWFTTSMPIIKRKSHLSLRLYDVCMNTVVRCNCFFLDNPIENTSVYFHRFDWFFFSLFIYFFLVVSFFCYFLLFFFFARRTMMHHRECYSEKVHRLQLRTVIFTKNIDNEQATSSS